MTIPTLLFVSSGFRLSLDIYTHHPCFFQDLAHEGVKSQRDGRYFTTHLLNPDISASTRSMVIEEIVETDAITVNGQCDKFARVQSFL